MKQLPLLFAAAVMTVGTVRAQAQTTNAVTSGDFINFTINALPDPTFTLQRGVTYVFQINNLFSHPFWIKSVLGGNFSGAIRREF